MILTFATSAVQLRYKFIFRKNSIRGQLHFQDISIHIHIRTIHQRISLSILTFTRLQNLIQRQSDTVNMTPPCKYFITHAKILHAKYFMQHMQHKGATKTEQSRRKLRNKTTVFMVSYVLFFVTKNKEIKL
jgi:hypothetical protein